MTSTTLCPRKEVKPSVCGVVGRPLPKVLPSAGYDHDRCPRMVFNITFRVNASATIYKFGALVDRGASGGIAGWDMTLVDQTETFIDLTGLEEHTVRKLRLVHVAFVCESHLGPIICHMPQQAHMPDNKSVMSCLQMEAFGCTVQVSLARSNSEARHGHNCCCHVKTAKGNGPLQSTDERLILCNAVRVK